MLRIAVENSAPTFTMVLLSVRNGSAYPLLSNYNTVAGSWGSLAPLLRWGSRKRIPSSCARKENRKYMSGRHLVTSHSLLHKPPEL